MKIKCTYDKRGSQHNDQTWMIEHQERLFKIDNHVDTSYDSQSHANLRIMTRSGEWENLTQLHATLDKDFLFDQVKPFIKKYTKYLPKKETVQNGN